jgi:hypothetical protein
LNPTFHSFVKIIITFAKTYNIKAMKHIFYITIVFLTCTLLSAQAQNNTPDLQRELTLEKEYNPSLQDANKINQLPEIKAPEAPRTKVEFSNYTLDYNLPPYLSTLGAKTYFSDFATSNKRGYVNLEISSLLDINGDLGYQLLNSPEDQLSLFGSHRSTNCNVTYLQNDEKQKMKFNDEVLNINYMHHFGKAKLFADAQYTYSAFNYYGLPIRYDPANDDVRFKATDNQTNNMFQAHAGIESVNNEEIAYKANLSYTLFNQKRAERTELNGRKENRIMADFDLHAKFFGIAGAVKTYSYAIPASWEVSNDDDDYTKNLGNYNYTTFSVNPYFTFEGDTWNTRLGATANIQLGGIKKFLVAPDIRFNWQPVDKFLFYLLAQGGIKDNSNYDLYYENRYVDPFYRVYDSKSPLDATVGVNFSVFPNLGIDLFTGYKLVKDEHFYNHGGFFGINDYMAQKILPQYANAETFKLGGSVKYTYQDIFDWGLKLAYYHWDIKKLSNLNYYNPAQIGLKAWNKPAFTGDLNIGFRLPIFPLRFDLTYHLEAGRKALYEYGNEVNMKNIHDVSSSATYTFNETISFFARANNLLFQKYDLWYGYPAQDFNIMGGISVRF